MDGITTKRELTEDDREFWVEFEAELMAMDDREARSHRADANRTAQPGPRRGGARSVNPRQFWIVAGPKGAGKPSLVRVNGKLAARLEVIKTDEIVSASGSVPGTRRPRRRHLRRFDRSKANLPGRYGSPSVPTCSITVDPVIGSSTSSRQVE